MLLAVSDLPTIATSPDVDAFVAGFVLVMSASFSAAVLLAGLHLIRRVLS